MSDVRFMRKINYKFAMFALALLFFGALVFQSISATQVVAVGDDGYEPNDNIYSASSLGLGTVR